MGQFSAAVSARWGWPHSFVRDDRKDLFLGVTVPPDRELPSSVSDLPYLLEKHDDGRSGENPTYKLHFKKPARFPDGSIKTVLYFSKTKYGDDVAGYTWRYFVRCYERLYNRAGVPEGRGKLHGHFHGDVATRTFKVTPTTKTRTYYKVSDPDSWDPAEECFLTPGDFCTNHKKLFTKDGITN